MPFDEVGMRYEDAIYYAIHGYKISRYGWMNANKYIYLKKERATVKIRNNKCIRTKHPPHIDLHDIDCVYMGWVPDDEDKSTSDWYVLK